MHIYLKPFSLFAVCVDFYIDKNSFKIYSAEKYKGETIIDIPIARIIFTPKSRLKEEKEYGNISEKTPAKIRQIE